MQRETEKQITIDHTIELQMKTKVNRKRKMMHQVKKFYYPNEKVFLLINQEKFVWIDGIY